jgi:hypothetical protein
MERFETVVGESHNMDFYYSVKMKFIYSLLITYIYGKIFKNPSMH